MSKDTGGHVFPRRSAFRDASDPASANSGMTLRQFYAGQAISGLISRHQSWSDTESMTSHAFRIADAMIAFEAKEGGAA